MMPEPFHPDIEVTATAAKAFAKLIAQHDLRRPPSFPLEKWKGLRDGHGCILEGDEFDVLLTTAADGLFGEVMAAFLDARFVG